jgi:uncharacterized repeat protein (TIGR01451 family)
MLLLAPLASAGRAQDRPAGSALQVTADNVTAREAQRVGAEAMPGDVIRYSLRFTNPTAAAVRNVVFDNPVPAGTRYVAGTARADAAGLAVTYSIDGGSTYSAQPMIEQVVDGRRRTVPAPVAMYTHLRWTVTSEVAAGAQVTAEFRVRVTERAPGRDSLQQAR